MSLRLFVIAHKSAPVDADFKSCGGWHQASIYSRGKPVECVHAFTSEADAWQFLLDAFPGDEMHERAMRSAWRVVELGEVLS